MRLLPVLLLAALPLAAQRSTFDEAFFAGDRTKVLRELTERGKALNSKDAKLLVVYGQAYLAALDRQRGVDLLRMAEAREPDDGQVLRLIGRAYLKNGFKNEALAAYEQVLRRDPKNKEAVAGCATDLAEVGLVAEAEKYMNAYLAREPKEWKQFIAFGRAYLLGGFRKQAAPWFARALYLEPDKDEAFALVLQAFTDSQSVM